MRTVGAGRVGWRLEPGQSAGRRGRVRVRVRVNGRPRDAAPEKWPWEMKFRIVCRLSDVWSNQDGKSMRI